MTSPLCVATGGWCRRVFHYRPPTPMYRNSPPLCTIVLQIPSFMPLKMRKVQLSSAIISSSVSRLAWSKSNSASMVLLCHNRAPDASAFPPSKKIQHIRLIKSEQLLPANLVVPTVPIC